MCAAVPRAGVVFLRAAASMPPVGGPSRPSEFRKQSALFVFAYHISCRPQAAWRIGRSASVLRGVWCWALVTDVGIAQY